MPGEQEVQRPQPEDRERVRREHDERVVGDREDRRDRVDREHRRRSSRPATSTASSGVATPLAGLAHEEALPVVLVGHRHDPAEQPAAPGSARGGSRRRACSAMLDAGEHEERAEDVDRSSGSARAAPRRGDEDRAEHERAEDAPEQHAVLVLAGHGEVREDQGEDEDVVDREALLDQVAGEVLARRPARPSQQLDDHAEGEAERDPDAAETRPPPGTRPRARPDGRRTGPARAGARCRTTNPTQAQMPTSTRATPFGPAGARARGQVWDRRSLRSPVRVAPAADATGP